MKSSIRNKVVNALIESELVDKGRLNEFLEKMKGAPEEDIFTALVEEGIVSQDDLLTVMGRELDMPPVKMPRVDLDERIMSLVPEKLARKYNVIPLSRVGRSLTLIVSDPTDIFAIDDVRTITNCEVRLVLASKADLEKTLRIYYEGEEEEDIATLIEAEEMWEDI